MKNKEKQEIFRILRFTGLFFAIFTLSFSLLYITGIVPSSLREGENFFEFLERKTLAPETITTPFETPKEKPELPIHISAPSAGIDYKVLNPEKTDVAVLDAYLKEGVVRYPTSGKLPEGNMLLFGHSAGDDYPNKVYKAFNGVKKLQEGDEVYIDSENYRYVYVVQNTRLVDATKELIEFKEGVNMVTLSTCNTFGKKQDRYVSEAVFKEKLAF